MKDHHKTTTTATTGCLDQTCNLLNFSTGSLITNITTCNGSNSTSNNSSSSDTGESGLWRGDHRGNKDMLLPMSHIRLLTKDELEFVSDLVSVCVCVK